ncbi:alpha/beta hydrolase [Bradyrhizobium sp. AUGA SZCCT0240]|uniref:esterase/lipase family protein n=1 Tax=unclassified Bradyrhizobium TaxID=2631580 RepID=UPI001BADE13F|nr:MULTISPECIES: alpha/beta hydrolase [unclassified Bradyrhizobium]MBR1193865.1 alpha/beta hydrolase [Bradyrhizobium sp. AUGA SZCCT0160]MBR1200786.1 alpha/beta hydrolase [Bradyrhizobium sp. AUGA SZCCT0158]MBR1245168.1 alpha/beta hydrolase [Bradyrhizobium sp. AUGA SZCCT0274]MBR1258716.1 alpha/beta hydrolase [Bradyrhizobium sp. AUGA SZCCT0240]
MPAATQSFRPPSKILMMLEGRRALSGFGAFLGALPILNLVPKGDGHPVLVLPGLMAGDDSTLPLRKFLEGRGYRVSGWGLGLNRGLREGVHDRMLNLVRELSDLHGGKISIVGWSLGGIYARELAKILPDRVRSVISLGSPFGASPKSTNAWRVYEFASGQSIDDAQDVAVAPPVPTTAIYSRTDGICAWQGCVEETSAQAESIEVQGSHCGLAVNPAAVYAVADRLAQPEGGWTPFDRSGWRSLIFPDPSLGALKARNA